MPKFLQRTLHETTAISAPIQPVSIITLSSKNVAAHAIEANSTF